LRIKFKIPKMFLDQVNLTVKGGKGGDGAMLFRHEKYVPRGGPEGGDGGKGGDVVFIADTNLDTLSNFANRKVFSAEDGEKGGSNRSHGRGGVNLVLKVPIGTVVHDLKSGKKIADLVERGQEYVIAHGGRGGYGNAHFTSSIRQTPDFAELGERGKELKIKLELKLVADIGLIGYPNAGKSTLISVISNARPKIANYPFTTLVPNLGIAKIKNEELIVADIPGLIEGAHEGKGLGHEFLRHIERTRLLIHLVDGTQEEVGKFYRAIREELVLHSKALARRPEIAVISKSDAFDFKQEKKFIAELKKAGAKKIFVISAVAHRGTEELLLEALKMVKKIKARTQSKVVSEITGEEEFKVFLPGEVNEEKDKTSTRNWALKKSRGSWLLTGLRLEQIVEMSDLANPSARARVHDIFGKVGVMKELKKQGAN